MLHNPMELGRLSERSDAGHRLLILSGRLESRVFNFSHGLSFKVDLIGVIDKPVEDGLSQGRVPIASCQLGTGS